MSGYSNSVATGWGSGDYSDLMTYAQAENVFKSARYQYNHQLREWTKLTDYPMKGGD